MTNGSEKFADETVEFIDGPADGTIARMPKGTTRITAFFIRLTAAIRVPGIRHQWYYVRVAGTNKFKLETE